VLCKRKHEEQWAVEKKAMPEKKKSIERRKLIFSRAKQ
jgi:large subunit ribosomal protein L7e